MRAAVRKLQSRIGTSVWLASNSLEESREGHATQGRYMRSAACCVGLALLHLVGGHA